MTANEFAATERGERGETKGENKKGDKMADQNLIIKMLLDANQYDRGLAKAQKSVQGFISDNMTLGGIMGQVGKALGTVAAAAGVAAGAFEGIKKTIASTQTLTDKFGRNMEGLTASVNSFFFALATGDFKGFTDGLKQTIDYAKKAYDALDDLGTFQIFSGAEGAEIKSERAKLAAQIKSGYKYVEGDNGEISRVKLTTEEMERAKERLKQVDAEYIKLIKSTKEKEETAYNSLANKLISENHGIGNEKELAQLVDAYMKSYGSYSEAQKRFDELQKKVNEDTKTYETGGHSTSWGYYGGTKKTEYGETAQSIMQSQEYKNLQAILQISDENLKALMGHRVAAAAATAELYAQLRSDEKVLKSTEPKATNGKEAKDTKMTPEEAWMSYQAEKALEELENPIEDFGYTEEEILDLAGNALAQHKKDWAEFVKSLEKNCENATELLGGLSGAFAELANVVGGTAGENIKAIGEFLNAAEGMVPVVQSIIATQEAKKLSDQGMTTAEMQAAAAQAGNAVAGVPLAGPALAIAAITSILGMVGAIKAIKFAEGGVVPGNNYTDGIQARISSGEVVLNSHDAKNLYDQIHSGNIGGGGGAGYVSGENIYIGLNNYLGRSGKGRLVVR